ncbi:MAG: M1 family metallopeptidase, partial [Ginsengibacter sp.]
MKQFTITCCLICIYCFCFSQSPYFQQRVDYSINVTLNDVNNTLDGFETINYTNQSPDTLSYIWFHLWPNAFKNDRTAFSEQLLQLGRTDFYFSDENNRGYINRLDFKVNGITANIENHPKYVDVVKLVLPFSLLPGQSIKINTPFHEKIPFNFSRGGHVGETYQITQWYPKPAVYDKNGWHPMPYLDQGEFYSEFGNFQVQITVPSEYVIAATGELQNEGELKWLKKKAEENNPFSGKPVKQSDKKHQQFSANISINNEVDSRVKNGKTKTLTYIQNDVHDFAWFADKNFLVRYDTLTLPSGRVIDAFSFFMKQDLPTWKNSIQFIKDAIRTRSKWLGEYPYGVVTTVEAKMGFSGGMEYPTITSISPMPDEKSLDMTI